VTKNRENDGVLSFDGFQWMGGHNNQPRFGLSRGCTGEFSRARRKKVLDPSTKEKEAKKMS
jgi:hypothetical protein